MSKFIVTAAASSRAITGEAACAVFEGFAVLAVRNLPDLSRLVVNTVDVRAPSAGGSNYAATVELSMDSVPAALGAPLEDAWKPLLALDPEASLSTYRVSERVQLERPRTWPVGAASPGVKAIYLVRRRDGLSNEEATSGWRAHADTARRHHLGMCRYVQNGVIETLTPGAPLIHGIAELHFPTLFDLEQRMYDSEDGRAKIQSEASQLVGEVTALYTTEYILRDGGL